MTSGSVRITKPAAPMGERISWPLTFAYHYLAPAIMTGACIVFCAWFSWDSARSHKWIPVGEGIIGATLAGATFRHISRLRDLWLRGDVLLFARGEDRVEVPIDRVTTVHVPVRSWLTQIVSIYWMDDSGVERRVKIAVRGSSPNWRSLFQRLIDRVPPVHVTIE